MKEELIKYDTAVLAKEKGYPLGRKLVNNSYTQLGTIYKGGIMGSMCYEHYPAPTQSLLQRWLREEHKTHVNPIPTYKQFIKYHLGIVYINSSNKVDTIIIKDQGMPTNKLFDTYEEALEVGLIESLKLIKQ